VTKGDLLAELPSTLGLTNPFPAFKNARISGSSRESSTRVAI
jgi:hypothetical protein